MQNDLNLLDICYNALLGREPDDSARANWAASDRGASSFYNLLSNIASSPEFSTRQKEAQKLRRVGNLDEFFNEQSQFGEVGRLIRQMVNTSASRKMVVDIGANGRERSNSYDLLRYFGWQGLLIEANSQRNQAIDTDFAGLNYRLVNCAISDYEGEASFHLGINDDVSSLKEEAAVSWGPVRGTTTVIVRPLPSVLSEYGIPSNFDLLSIDAEGEDIRILNDTIDKGYRPQWIIIEAVHNQGTYSLDAFGFTELVLTTYKLVDSTVANLILRCSNDA